MRALRQALLLLLQPALSGCGSVPTEVPPNPNRCGHDVQASVSPGLTPTISWTPACEVGAISVVRMWLDSTGSTVSELVWAIETSNEADRLTPPVIFGVTPLGVRSTAPARPLVVGQWYNLTLEVHYREKIGPVVSVGFDPVARLSFQP
jgi:hypothetical protein